MQEIVLDETVGDMDKNRDGYVTLQEYVGVYVVMPLTFAFSIVHNKRVKYLVYQIKQHGFDIGGFTTIAM